MVRFKTLIFICVFVSGGLFSQNFTEKGLVRATATISPSWGIDKNDNNVYLNGEVEVFLSDKYSIRGDIFGLVGTLEKQQNLKMNHHLFVGPQFHKSWGIIDYFGGFQSGLTLAQFNDYSLIDKRKRVTPNISLNTGISFYIHEYFHFFLNFRYINHFYRSIEQKAFSYDEFVISAGLGFQIRTLKNKK